MKSVFDLFDADSNGKLGLSEVEALLKALDIDVEDEGVDVGQQTGVSSTAQRLFATADRDGSGSIDFDELQAALASHAFYEIEAGRYWVVLSLPEAAGLRRVLHLARQGTANATILPPKSAFSLLIGGGAASGHAIGSSVRRLDATPTFRSGSVHQRAMALQCLRFYDAETDFSESAVNQLLRAMHHTTIAARQKFFETVTLFLL